MTRILLYTGKGGVGKTSIAAATALLCADRGLRTIVLSTDIAHSLADAFDVPLGPEPTQIAPNLDGQEPDVYYNIARYWRTIQNYVSELFAWRGLDEVMAEEMTVLPGMDELGNLLWITDHVDSGQVRRHRGRRGADRRDAPPPVAARCQPLVDRADRPDRPSHDAARPADARARPRHPDPARRGVRRRRAAARPPRRGPSAAERSRIRPRSGSPSRSTSSRSRKHAGRSPTSTCSAIRAT